MNRWRQMILLLAALLLTAACSGKQTGREEHGQHAGPVPSSVPLTITFAADPTQLPPGGTVTLTSEVRQGNKPLDAEVEFEVWRTGSEHRRLTASKKKAGFYAAGMSGLEPGEYSVIVHVTAPGIHQMTSGRFTVSGEKHHHEHGHNAVLHIQVPDTVQAGSKTLLTAHVMLSGKPASGAAVQFEYWTGSGKHAYVKADETKPGEYGAEAVFPAPGSWHLKLHVEKGNLHDHREITLNVR